MMFWDMIRSRPVNITGQHDNLPVVCNTVKPTEKIPWALPLLSCDNNLDDMKQGFV